LKFQASLVHDIPIKHIFINQQMYFAIFSRLSRKAAFPERQNAHIIATYNILSSAALLVNKGLGCAVCLYGGALPTKKTVFSLIFIPALH